MPCRREEGPSRVEDVHHIRLRITDVRDFCEIVDGHTFAGHTSEGTNREHATAELRQIFPRCAEDIHDTHAGVGYVQIVRDLVDSQPSRTRKRATHRSAGRSPDQLGEIFPGCAEDIHDMQSTVSDIHMASRIIDRHTFRVCEGAARGARELPTPHIGLRRRESQRRTRSTELIDSPAGAVHDIEVRARIDRHRRHGPEPGQPREIRVRDIRGGGGGGEGQERARRDEGRKERATR